LALFSLKLIQRNFFTVKTSNNHWDFFDSIS
jgi:hypothetical protein